MPILEPIACRFGKAAMYNIISAIPKNLPNKRETNFQLPSQFADFQS